MRVRLPGSANDPELLTQVENFQRVVLDRDHALAESVLDDGNI
jgi:hypothetical protein